MEVSKRDAEHVRGPSGMQLTFMSRRDWMSTNLGCGNVTYSGQALESSVGQTAPEGLADTG